MMWSRLDEVNVCDVGGPGKGPGKIYRYRTSGTENDSPWARRAVFRGASSGQVDSTGELDDIGDETLNKQRARRQITFNARQTVATRYGRDWDVGDLVTVEFLGRSYDKKIVGVTIGVSESGEETIAVETEDA